MRRGHQRRKKTGGTKLRRPDRSKRAFGSLDSAAASNTTRELALHVRTVQPTTCQRRHLGKHVNCLCSAIRPLDHRNRIANVSSRVHKNIICTLGVMCCCLTCSRASRGRGIRNTRRSLQQARCFNPFHHTVDSSLKAAPHSLVLMLNVLQQNCESKELVTQS